MCAACQRGPSIEFIISITVAVRPCHDVQSLCVVCGPGVLRPIGVVVAEASFKPGVFREGNVSVNQVTCGPQLNLPVHRSLIEMRPLPAPEPEAK